MTTPLLRLLLVGTALSGTGWVQNVHAQATDPGARMTAIERQIQSLQSELRQMRRDLSSRDAQVRSAQADAARARQEVQAAQTRSAGRGPQVGQVAGAQGQTSHGSEVQGQGGGAQTGAQGPGQQGPGNQLALQNATEQAQSGQASGPLGTFKVGAVTVKLGGFVEAAGIYRSRNEVADIGSNFSTGIPFANSPLSHEGEFRGSARQSRLSLLATGNIDDAQKLAAYFEVDFQGGAPTANSVESNSYNPRLRQAYGTYDNTAWGLHFLGGQAWSLATMSRDGIVPMQEDVPLTIDAQYVPGFTWTRQPQIRLAKDFADRRLWIAASLENPQTSYYVGPNGTGAANGTANYQNPGIGILGTGGQFTTEVAPDVILKAAYDPGWGHYEVYGLGRFLHDRVSVVGDGRNNTVFAGGVGGGLILPVVKKKLDVELRGLVGYGIGRYGTSQLPDATIGADGSPKPLAEYQALMGIISHPAESVDVYGYAGTEQERRKSFAAGGRGYGYGSPLYSNAGCGVELSTLACTANTSGVVQGTLGGWWRFFRGNYGTAEVGAQYSYTRRSVFGGVGGHPSADENTALVSFRYLPFQ